MWESHDQGQCIIMKNDKWLACGDRICGALALIAAFPSYTSLTHKSPIYYVTQI